MKFLYCQPAQSNKAIKGKATRKYNSEYTATITDNKKPAAKRVNNPFVLLKSVITGLRFSPFQNQGRQKGK